MIKASGYYAIKNKVKNYDIRKNSERPLNNKDYDYYSMSNCKYHYIAVTKPNALLGKSVSVIFRQMNNLNNTKSHAKIMITVNWKYLKNLRQY